MIPRKNVSVYHSGQCQIPKGKPALARDELLIDYKSPAGWNEENFSRYR